MLTYDIKDKRILEVGCGMALASHVINNRSGDITATDYHPEVEGFLERNTKLNNAEDIPFIRMGWADTDSVLGKFDLIIGSDLCYEIEHVKVLSGFINQHAKQSCEVVIVDPGRNHFPKFVRAMQAFNFIHSRQKPEDVSYLKSPFKGYIHKFTR